jgi:hypothetical protein
VRQQHRDSTHAPIPVQQRQPYSTHAPMPIHEEHFENLHLEAPPPYEMEALNDAMPQSGETAVTCRS